MARRLIEAAVVLAVVAGCAAPSRTPGPSDAASQSALPASPGGSPVGSDTDTGPALVLQPTLDEPSSSSALIGWEGGSVSAIGSDGATYTLEIPPEALAFPTEITMTPLSNLDGFGLDPAPEHLLGVQLAPEGLQMAVPARLTMATGAAVPEAGVATGDYLGQGQDAGLIMAEFADSDITVDVPHFSGYWAVWPLKMEQWRTFGIRQQDDAERNFENSIAFLTEVDRQKQMLGMATRDIWDVARSLAKQFEREVLNPRRERAGLGCAEAELALAGYLSYERTLQMLGIAVDEWAPGQSEQARALYEELKRPIPPSLLSLTWNLCLGEEYQRCANTGEFPRLAAFLLTQYKQREVLAIPLTAEELSQGQDRLERCGQWRVRLKTIESLAFPGGVGGWDQDWTIEIDVRFRAGGPPFGLSGATVDGTGEEIQVTKLDATLLDEHATLRNIHTSVKPEARIIGMTFEDSWELDPEPVAKGLILWINPGEVSWEGLNPYFVSGYKPYSSNWALSSQLIFGTYPPTIADGWHFLNRPYRALFGHDGSGAIQGTNIHSWIEVTVEHTPDSSGTFN